MEYSGSDQTPTNTDDTASGTSEDILDDFMSEYLKSGECKKLDDMTLTQKIQLSRRLKESSGPLKEILPLVQKSFLNQEKEEANQRAGEQFALCETCHLVEDTRERKQAGIRQLHLQVLANKPAVYMCTPGIFSRLEKMAARGRLDFVGGAQELSRCSECRQVTDTSAIQSQLKSEVIDVLYSTLEPESASEEVSIENCSLERACSLCLQYVRVVSGYCDTKSLILTIMALTVENEYLKTYPLNCECAKTNEFCAENEYLQTKPLNCKCAKKYEFCALTFASILIMLFALLTYMYFKKIEE